MAKTTFGVERLVTYRRCNTRGKERRLLLAVTLVARNLDVLSRQRIAAFVVVVQNRLEAFLYMAAVAVLFELAKVSVVGVAIRTALEGEAPKHLVLVACVARDRFMLAEKREPRGVVVERGIPGVLVVAALAFRPQARFVRISMAARARRKGDPLPLLVRMATLTLHAAMCPHERICGGGMIEVDLRERGFHPVTPTAVFTELPVMDVLVAGDATRVAQ